MPNVPNLPGVPTLSSYDVSFLATEFNVDAVTVLGGIFLPRWGVFRNGIPVIIADNVASVDYRQDWSIATYQIEAGGFTSYDKVNSPFEARVRFTSGGSLQQRQALLNSVQAISDSLDLFDVITPEINYLNVNLSHYDYSRSAERGAGLISIETWWTQIRETGEQAFTMVQAPSGASQASGGLVQSIPATPPQNAAVGLSPIVPGVIQ